MLIHPHIHHHRADRRLASAVAMQSEATAQGKAVRGGVGSFARMRSGVLVLANEPTSQPRRCHLKRHSSGLTLIELLVVLVILAALAGVVLPHMNDLRIGPFGTRGESPQEIATKTTLLRVRAAIMGDESMPGLWQDLGGLDKYMPEKMGDLLMSDAGLTSLSAVLPASLEEYDPNTRLGWRGPYLMSSGARYGADDPPYGTEGDPAVLDGWGHPVVIQFPTTAVPTDSNRYLYARLVSAGPNGVIDTPLSLPPPNTFSAPPPAGVLTIDDCGDDSVLFLRVADTRIP